MNTSKASRSYLKHLANAGNPNHVYTESEIRALRMCLHAQKNTDDALRIIMEKGQHHHAITLEQSRKGINFLRHNLFTKTGALRQSKFAKCFSEREIAIIRGFTGFTFDGLKHQTNPYSGYVFTSPIYRLHGLVNGSKCSFTYTMLPGDLPEILE